MQFHIILYRACKPVSPILTFPNHSLPRVSSWLIGSDVRDIFFYLVLIVGFAGYILLARVTPLAWQGVSRPAPLPGPSTAVYDPAGFSTCGNLNARKYAAPRQNNRKTALVKEKPPVLVPVPRKSSPAPGHPQSSLLAAIDRYDLDLEPGEMNTFSSSPVVEAALERKPPAAESVKPCSTVTSVTGPVPDRASKPLEKTLSTIQELPLPLKEPLAAAQATPSPDISHQPPEPAASVAPSAAPAPIPAPKPSTSPPAADLAARPREEMKTCVYGIKAFEYAGVNTNGYKADCTVYSIRLESVDDPHFSDTRYFATTPDYYEVAYFKEVPVPLRGSYNYTYTIRYYVRYSGGAERYFTKTRQVKTYPRDRGRWYTETDLLKSYEIPSP